MASTARIRVALDARWAQQHQHGGVARGIRSLVPRLAEHVDVTAIVDPRLGELELPGDVSKMEITLPIKTPALVWLHTRLPVALRSFDGIFHDPFNFLPLVTPIPSVVTIHDLSFETHPHLFPHAKGLAFRMNARWAARKATCITTVSDWSRQELIDRYRVSPERVQIVPNGVEPSFRPLDDEDRSVLKNYATRAGIAQPYVIAFGGKRRGPEVSVGAWRSLRRMGYPHDVVILGDQGPTEAGVHWVPRPSQQELRLLLAGAELLLYPTETESFGLPALEALACGTVAVCHRVGALPEILGDAAVWCERTPGSIAEAADRILREPKLEDTHVSRGLAVAKRWSWDEAARRLLDVYTRVASDRPPKRRGIATT